MENIGKINGYNVSTNYRWQQEEKEGLSKEAKTENKAAEKAEQQVSEKEVFNYIGGYNAAFIKPAENKSVNELLAKYITPESEARITSFVKGLEADYENAFATTTSEFPEISQKAAGEIALAYINASYK
ncbi:MAG: hypothetical protein IJY61_07800 [Candidatus Gastranaerophilales bacterium]|nr:hypothetical protein [Candidatus Gastranaerophilales bacterium]